MDSLLIITLGILAGCLLGLSWFAGSDAPFVATKMDLIKKVLQAAGVKKGLPAGRQAKVFYELGSGDGRVVLEFGIKSRVKGLSLSLDNRKMISIEDEDHLGRRDFLYFLPASTI